MFPDSYCRVNKDLFKASSNSDKLYRELQFQDSETSEICDLLKSFY